MTAIRHFDPDLLHEVSQRVIGGAFCLDPNNLALREAFLGALAKSLHRYGVQVLAFHFMSNHYHALYKIPSAEKFSRFLAHFHSGLTAAYHRICRTDGKLWGYAKWNPVANDEASVCLRLKYIMGQAVAAGIVDHPAQFPGASSVDAMLGLSASVGRVFDATRKCRDRRKKNGAAPDSEYESEHLLVVTPPDAWRQCSVAERLHRYWKLADEVARTPLHGVWKSQRLCQRNENTNVPVRSPLAKRAVRMRPTSDGSPFRAGPVKPKLLDIRPTRRPRAPLLLAADRAVVAAYARRYADLVVAYRVAKRAWLAPPRPGGRPLLPTARPLPLHTLAGTLSCSRSATVCRRRASPNHSQ